MTEPIVEDLLRLEKGIVAYDAYMQKDVIVIAPVLAILADNSRHSELLNHAGPSANKYCRMCMVSFFSIIINDYSIILLMLHNIGRQNK